MKKTVAIIGSLDTKGEEFKFLKESIEKNGLSTFVFDVGVLGDPLFEPDVRADEIAKAGGSDLDTLRKKNNRGFALDTMAAGIAVVVKEKFDQGKFDGIISMGGGGGTGVGTSGMRTLPVGVPKIMVSTVASADTSPYVGTTDIMMMPSIVDISGLNRISKIIFRNAANAISGMVLYSTVETNVSEERPLIAATMFGNTTRAVNHARKIIEDAGYEVLVFHCTGTGGKTMEMLIHNDYFKGVLDITTTEWADEICGGVLSASDHRLEAAALKGIPQVVTPGCIDMVNFWGEETVPEKYKDRLFYHWNPNVTLMRTNVEENATLGKIFAEKLNMAIAPVKVLIPLKGFSEIDAPGQPFWWPEANQAFINELTKRLKPEIEIILMDNNVNDPEFSERCATELLKLLDSNKN
ncbi:MAG TPA: Tm-1-like ATP-binding domain-containing protein [Flexilinea sp.]|nr:Tm-1-like ATP-binding domain-containing protein [Flexilinea sp.]